MSRHGRGWRWFISANMVVSLLLAALLVVMLNYVLWRHGIRRDLSRSQYYALSGKTHYLLDCLPGDIDIKVFFHAGHEALRDLQTLLREYSFASKRLHVEYIDPDRDLSRTKELALKYEVTESDVIVFASGSRRKQVTARELAEYDYTPMLSGQPKKIKVFKGEQAISSAIRSVIQTNRPVVYFLRGHDERDIENYNPEGYTSIARQIHRDHIEVRSMVFGAVRSVPEDCGTLIIAGPRKKLSQPEEDIIRKYLDQSGRLFFLIDGGGDCGLEGLLGSWGVQLGHDRVIGLTLTGRELLVTEYGAHAITRELKNVTTLFSLPRSVNPVAFTNEVSLKQADKPQVVPLASCSVQGWAETDPDQNPPKFDPDIDRPGPVPVAIAVEKGPTRGTGVNIRPVRIVVIGDSAMVANGALAAGYNADFFMSALNWLLAREDLMAITTHEAEQFRVIMNRDQIQSLFWVVVVGIPCGATLMGCMVWWRRRK